MKEKVIVSKFANHYEGLNVKENSKCLIKLTNTKISIVDIFSKPLLDIELTKIINVGIITEKDLIEKNKSVIIRGVVGSVLFGGGGLILGGLSGIGTKKKQKDIDYLIINYKEANEEKVVSLITKKGIMSNTFIDMIRTQINNMEQ